MSLKENDGKWLYENICFLELVIAFMWMSMIYSYSEIYRNISIKHRDN